MTDDTVKPVKGLVIRTEEEGALSHYRGLRNQGATCYLNATLQVLFMTEAFRERVLLGTPCDTSEILVSALKELFEELSSQDGAPQSVSTKGVIKALGIQNGNVDAHTRDKASGGIGAGLPLSLAVEAFNAVDAVDALRSIFALCEQQDAVEHFLEILEKAGPNLAEVFSGTMRNNRVCSEGHTSHDDSSFKSIPIALNARDGTSCEIHEHPAVLALHLKRFVYDYRSHMFKKNECPVDVPLRLSLQEHEYSLYAVINHSGSRHGGHYTADIRSFTENKWYCFNDSYVRETNERKLKW
ncbi:Ubiquitin carboxyl-terminal hydrolase 21 [Labeo rohita]|uniref:Ubiquitin carboxyl-terminal hydrolase 21 n=1 Tax=Labeo rohita TaxID=84645 RepID=A0ABQ8LAV9_LABRO|nr:Ubiquitin carboxyl-terminal hydrolase 21 [Labeo rohita]